MSVAASVATFVIFFILTPLVTAQTTYNFFTNSLVSNVASPGVIWLPNAGARGMYVGALTTNPPDPFLLYGSPNLENLFSAPSTTYNFRTQANTEPINNFKDPKYQGEYVCEHESPSLEVWGGKLYMIYSAKPTDSTPDNATTLCGSADDLSPNYVMFNDDPSDPFCTRNGGVNCWFRVDSNWHDPFPGRAWSFVVRNGKTSNPELWAVFTNGPVKVLQMTDPGTPKKSPQNAISISDSALSVLTTKPPAGSAEEHNFRSFELRHYTNNGVNEGPEIFAIDYKNGTEKIYVTYSTNTYTDGDYLLGMVEFTGGPTDALDAGPFLYDTKQNKFSSLWTKRDNPVFQGDPGYYNDKTPAQYRNHSYHQDAPPVGAELPVCSVGTNSIVPSPDGTELWQVYDGRYVCGYKAANQNGTKDSINDYYLTVSTLRTIRIQRVHVDETGPLFDSPWIDGVLHTRPSGEDTSTPPAQLMKVIGQGPKRTFNGTDSQIFTSSGWQSDFPQPGQQTSDHQDSYLMVFYEGGRIRLQGPVGSNCIRPGDGTPQPGRCGTVRFIVDGHLQRAWDRDLFNLTDTDIFDSDNTDGKFPELQQGGQHSVIVRLLNSTTTRTFPVTLEEVIVGHD